jgi:hypothetical protein
VWQVAIAFSGLAFLVVFIEKEVPLRKELDTKYGLEQQKKVESQVGNGGKEALDEQVAPDETASS